MTALFVRERHADVANIYLGSNQRSLLVKIERDTVRYQKTFSFSSFGSAAVALRAARTWRNRQYEHIRAHHPPTVRFGQQRPRGNVPVSGVCCGEQYDRRKDKFYWLAQVHLRFSGQVYNRAFQAGNADTVDVVRKQWALATAIACRRQWERDAVANKPFDLLSWRYWRDEQRFALAEWIEAATALKGARKVPRNSPWHQLNKSNR